MKSVVMTVTNRQGASTCRVVLELIISNVILLPYNEGIVKGMVRFLTIIDGNLTSAFESLDGCLTRATLILTYNYTSTWVC